MQIFEYHKFNENKEKSELLDAIRKLLWTCGGKFKFWYSTREQNFNKNYAAGHTATAAPKFYKCVVIELY